VKTNEDTYYADKLVVAAELQQQLRRYRQVLYWFEITDSYQNFLPHRFPIFIWISGTSSEPLFYGFPAIDGPTGGLKVATEQYIVEEESADSINCNVSADEIQHMFQTWISGRIPALGPKCIKTQVGTYTVTSDFKFIIDYAPATTNVLIVSACSGHGFKHSAAIGESVAQLLTTGRSDKDLSEFALNRFF
jgi:sarcosine oxidase